MIIFNFYKLDFFLLLGSFIITLITLSWKWLALFLFTLLISLFGDSYSKIVFDRVRKLLNIPKRF